MARGFGGAGGQGSADTDILLAAYAGNSTQRSYAVWAYRTGAGGGNFGRMIEKPNSMLLLNDEGGSVYQFARFWSGGRADWVVTAPSANTWVRVVVTYDGGSTANDPVIYFNGSSQFVSENVPPSGTLDTNSNVYEVGNRSVDSARVWHGSLAGLTMWDTILTQSEIDADAKGASPLLIRPQSLAFYAPMVGPVSDWVNAGAWTVGGTLVQPHPRAIHAEGLVLFAPYAASGNAFARPTSDVTSGWLTSTGSGTHASHIDEVAPDDADYIYTDNRSAIAEVALTSVSDPGVNTGHIARYRAKSPYAQQVKLSLYQTTTLIAEWTDTLTTGYALYQHTLSGAEADSITNYAALRLRWTPIQ